MNYLLLYKKHYDSRLKRFGTMDNYINKTNTAILNEARDYIDGLLLSDGYIQLGNDKTGAYIQNCKYKNWLDIINRDLNEYTIQSKVYNGRIVKTNFSKKEGSLIYMLKSWYYIELKEMKDRWYKKYYNIDEFSIKRWNIDKKSGEYFVYTKIVPKDIILSPECVANWYIGDGYINKNIYNQVFLATCGFSEDDVVFLLNLLSDVLDIRCTVSKRGYILISNRSNVKTFLNYIKNYKVDCYSYKFPEVILSDSYN